MHKQWQSSKYKIIFNAQAISVPCNVAVGHTEAINTGTLNLAGKICPLLIPLPLNATSIESRDEVHSIYRLSSVP